MSTKPEGFTKTMLLSDWKYEARADHSVYRFREAETGEDNGVSITIPGKPIMTPGQVVEVSIIIIDTVTVTQCLISTTPENATTSHGTGGDDGSEVLESEVTWSKDQIFQSDEKYVNLSHVLPILDRAAIGVATPNEVWEWLKNNSPQFKNSSPQFYLHSDGVMRNHKENQP